MTDQSKIRNFSLLHTWTASSQSPLDSASAFGKNGVRSLAPPLPTKPKGGFAGAPILIKIKRPACGGGGFAFGGIPYDRPIQNSQLFH